MNLTPEEERLIKAKRTENEFNDKRVRYAMLVIELTAKWVNWSLKDGLGLTFSTFIDNFDLESHIPDEFIGYETALYESVKAVIKTADTHADKLTR